MRYVVVLLIVAVWLWLGRRRPLRAPRRAVGAPRDIPTDEPAPTPVVIAPAASAPAIPSPPLPAPRPPATAWMLRRHGLCSPDPHLQE